MEPTTFLFTNAGVTQGSILGPLLFKVVNNDIEKNIITDIFIFADDTVLADTYKNAQHAETRINFDLRMVSAWAKNWYVTFNIQKTVLLNFFLNIKKSTPSLIFNGSLIAHMSKHKHLGVVLTQDL